MQKDESERRKIIIDIIRNYYNVYHPYNKNTTLYLKKYYKNYQDILQKEKYTREEINNMIVENWCYANIEFKKAFLLGKPIKYVNANDETSEEISLLNDYSKLVFKNVKDSEIYEDILVCGRGYRYNNKNINEDEDSAPYETINCDVLNTEVIYSSQLGNEQLLTIIETPMEDIINIDQKVPYSKFDVYIRNKHYTITNNSNNYEFVSEETLLYNEHLINEWYINRERISLIEIGKDLYDLINKIESLDLDDMEQFVNAIMVFTNAKIDEEEIKAIKELGAVSISSTENRKASVELLQSRLNSQQTQSFYERIVNSLHQIQGIPIASSSGNMQIGDTGKANYTGQGYTSSGIRIQNDENMISMCDMKSMRLCLKICKQSKKSKIKSLRFIDVDNRLQLDNRENLLVKAQSLQTLKSAGVPDEFAVPSINLFPDPNAVVIAMKKQINNKLEELKNSSINSNNSNIVNEVNEDFNKVQDITEIDNQQK